METLLEVQGNFNEAINWYKKALGLEPKYTDEYSDDKDIKKHIDLCYTKLQKV